MTINKYQGRTKEEAVEKARQELGAGAVVLNVKEIKPKGMLKMFKDIAYEVTVALEEKERFQSALAPVETVPKAHESISLAADEKIDLPRMASEPEAERQKPVRQELAGSRDEKMREERDGKASEGLERRLENLSNILEKQLSVEGSREQEQPEVKAANPEGLQFVKMLYRTLLENDVNEKFVNQIMDEAEKVMRSGNSVDSILSNVYQKLILKFDQPEPINLSGKKPKIIFFVGPTGVGKTTTLAKIASSYKVNEEKKIAFLTADTYRIAATEQLRIYANILDTPMSVIYSVEEMNAAIERASDCDLIFVDTAGISHKNDVQCNDMKKLIDGLDAAYEKEVYLVLSATTKYRDLLEIADIYKKITEYKLIFTKLDETTTYGNILNIKLYSGARLSYMTVGQNVPDDIELFDTQKIVKQLLGGR